MSTNDFLIKNISLPDGEIVNIGINGDLITSISKESGAKAATAIDGTGCIALPG